MGLTVFAVAVGAVGASTSAGTIGLALLVEVGGGIAFGLVVRLLPVHGGEEAAMSWRERALVGWCGPRGAVSLAVVLSLPLVTAVGAPFPHRELLQFLTVVVVLVTLVGQTVPLPWLVRVLRLGRDTEERTEAVRARRAAVDAALRELDDIAQRDEPVPAGSDEIRQVLELRRDHLQERLEPRPAERSLDLASLRLRLLEVERDTLRRLHDDGEISRATMVSLSQDLDLDETQLHRRGSQ
ncbi:hypothetical protein GCM10009836_42320 [Pseudonocardia ailaonensis]|uniref:Cation/H+ exchanger transmembrane domain-containing protein n=1 Tax=Pseudonocardia ailaonensis TaxID=367279 RepID=A0ABN2N9F2_9PSEU